MKKVILKYLVENVKYFSPRSDLRKNKYDMRGNEMMS